MQTNHLSHFLLTAEVWPLIVAAAAARGEARVVQHSSIARERAGPDGIEDVCFGKRSFKVHSPTSTCLQLLFFLQGAYDACTPTRLSLIHI